MSKIIPWGIYKDRAGDIVMYVPAGIEKYHMVWLSAQGRYLGEVPDEGYLEVGISLSNKTYLGTLSPSLQKLGLKLKE